MPIKFYQILFVLIVILLSACGGQKDSNIAAIPNDGKLTLCIDSLGAVGDGQTINTEIIQQTIDSVASLGGGRVYVGPGKYLTGMLYMRSGVELYVDYGATILGSTNPYHYDDRGGNGKRVDENVEQALIMADTLTNISFCGHGTIDGQGLGLALAIDSLHRIGERIDPTYNVRRQRPTRRPKLFFINHCDNVVAKDLLLKNSAGWGFSCHVSTNMELDGLRVYNRAYWNNDGIDIDDCQHVRIVNCKINSADDGICLKSESGSKNDDILIENNLIISSASAVKFGTASYGGFTNVTIRNIEVYDTFRSAIALEAVDGAILENIVVDSIYADRVGNPLFIKLGARHTGEDGQYSVVRNIKISNMECAVSFERPDLAYDLRGPEVNYFHNPWPSSITGLPGHDVEDVTIENITFQYPGRASKSMAYIGLYRVKEVPEAEQEYPEFSMFGELPSWGFYVRHVNGLTMRNINLFLADEDFRPAFVLDDVKNLNLVSTNQPEEQIFVAE